MRSLQYLVLAILLCAALAVAGCTSSTANPPPVTATAISLPSIALDRSDLPDGYVLTMSKVKTDRDVSPLAQSLGWQAGYVVEYTKSAAPGTVVLHSLAGYKESSMPDVIDYIYRADRTCSDLEYFDIAVTGIGDDSRAFIGHLPNQSQIPVVTTVPAAKPLSDVAVSMEGTNTVTCGQGYLEIIFAKGNVLEVIRFSGPVIEDKEAIAIAQKAYAKIP
ncbi:hypothetical protein [Methanoregula sp.]|uniref:hypothetical protein n=1 Tax=Methanoregula sp. TaxID=2052170 RepID=UPI000CB85F10|nr:hypothetical protein [Methanoregula sp.]PKG33378.1 MAG: hypothetical protein CW742_03295 [Methanoregula sp.]